MMDIIYLLIAVAIGAMGAYGYSYFRSRSDKAHQLKQMQEQEQKQQALEDSCQNLKQECNQLEQKNNQLHQEQAACLQEQGRLQQKVQELESNLNTQEQEVLRLQATLSLPEDERHQKIVAEHIAAHKAEFDVKLNEQQRQIKDLEESNEELEDDLEDTKKELEEIQDAHKALREQFRENESLLNQHQQDLEKSQSELQDKTQELDRKSGALSLVSSLLTAPQLKNNEEQDEATLRIKNAQQIVAIVSEELPKKLERLKIEDITNAQESLKDLEDIREGVQIATKKFEEQLIDWHNERTEGLKWLAQVQKTWLSNKTTVSFIGEFSAGKTSIVKRLVYRNAQESENDTILSTSSKATTAIPTYIGYSPKIEHFSFVSPDDIQKGVERSTLEGLKREYLEDLKGVSSLIKYFVLGYPKEHLKGLSILDTPGFSSNDKEDAQRTMEVINESDALFWVVDVNTGTVNRESLRLIKEHLRKPLYIILNKVDTKSETEVNDVQTLIIQTFQNEGVAFERIIPFSQSTDLITLHEVFSDVKQKANNTHDYLQNLLDKTEKLATKLYEMESGFVEATQHYEENITRLEQVTEDLIRNIMQSSVDLANIPERKETWLGFGEDKYVMTMAKYDELCSIIVNIVGTEPNEGEEWTEDNNGLVQDLNGYIGLLRILDKSWKEFYENQQRFERIASATKGLHQQLQELAKPFNL